MHVYFPVRFRNDEHSGGPVASCGCPSPIFLVCYKQTKLPARWCPSFVLLLGSRKTNCLVLPVWAKHGFSRVHWPALSLAIIRPVQVQRLHPGGAWAARVSWQTGSTMESAGSGQDKLLPPKKETPYVIYFFHLRPPSTIPEPSNNLLEIWIYPWVKAFIRPTASQSHQLDNQDAASDWIPVKPFPGIPRSPVRLSRPQRCTRISHSYYHVFPLPLSVIILLLLPKCNRRERCRVCWGVLPGPL